MRFRTIVVALTMLLVLLFVVVSGVPWWYEGWNTPDTIAYNGNFSTENGDFSLNGTISNNKIQSDPPTYHNVSVYLYSESGRLLGTTDVGTLEYSANVSITTDERPHYIIIDTPDFWESSNVDVSYYKAEPTGEYTERGVTARADLPVRPQSSTTPHSIASSPLSNGQLR
ncbi:hypothetical protein [Halomarina rubra]|uniref:Uncharacterized protein n=1 Tax=Halomarina rubra TaxID=2071873 RepID=A0ABD6AWM4_9EURY|nr:hypothetical protein [Halomarina rubra]